jgi:hypothetical protein
MTSNAMLYTLAADAWRPVTGRGRFRRLVSGGRGTMLVSLPHYDAVETHAVTPCKSYGGPSCSADVYHRPADL